MEWFKITNIEQFVEATRVLVYSSFGSTDNADNFSSINTMLEKLVEEERKEIEELLPQKEAMSIFHEFGQTKRNKKRTEFYISDEAYYEFIESLNARLVSNMLNSMADKGIIESAFDTETNDFVFWIKEDNDKTKNKVVISVS